MHYHLIVGRKENNHKNIKKEMTKDSFNRKNLFQQTAKSFDKQFNHKRPLNKFFEYNNIIKNRQIEAQVEMWERIEAEIAAYRQTDRDEDSN